MNLQAKWSEGPTNWHQIGKWDYYKLSISPKLYCLCSRDIQNFIVCAVATFKTLLFVQSRHSKLYCLCSLDIQNFIVCAVATFKTLLFVQSRHSKLYCLCSRDIRNFIVCAIATFKTLLFVQSSHSKLFSLRVPSGAPYVRRLLSNDVSWTMRNMKKKIGGGMSRNKSQHGA